MHTTSDHTVSGALLMNFTHLSVLKASSHCDIAGKLLPSCQTGVKQRWSRVELLLSLCVSTGIMKETFCGFWMHYYFDIIDDQRNISGMNILEFFCEK